MGEKPLDFVAGALADLRAFPKDARRRAGFEEAVYVLHAFEKKTRKTPKRDIELARARLAQVVATRAGAVSSREDGS